MGMWQVQRDELYAAVTNVLEPSSSFDKEKLLELIEQDTRIEAIRSLSVENYERRMLQRFTQDPVSKITTDNGITDLMIDRNIKADHKVDIMFAIMFAESILAKFQQLENL
jgi:hypothetical protein